MIQPFVYSGERDERVYISPNVKWNLAVGCDLFFCGTHVFIGNAGVNLGHRMKLPGGDGKTNQRAMQRASEHYKPS